MDSVFIITTIISILTNIFQFFSSKKYYNIVFLHYSLLDQYDLSEFCEFTDLQKAKKMSRHVPVIFVGADPSIYRFDWVVVPESSTIHSPRVLYSPSESVFRGLLRG